MNYAKIYKNLEILESLPQNLINRDFFLTWEKTESELKALVLAAELLKHLHASKIPFRIFDHGLGISIFKDNSTRTRFSFISAINALGLGHAEMEETKSQLSHGETIRETANMISFLAEVIGIRDDMYLGEGDRYQREIAAAVETGFQEGTLHQRPQVINLQSDLDHPTQTLADLGKLKDYFGGFNNLRGKKIAVTWAYSPSYGKPLSVPQGLINLMCRLGMNVSLAYPEGYDLLPELTENAQKLSRQSGGNFSITNSMADAFHDADIVYPKSWAPFSIMQQRVDLLKNNDLKGLKDLEKTCLASNAKHTDWECNRKMMDLTRDKQALYQHCLPADISGISCSHGEVSAEIFEQYRRHTYHQASFKPFIIAAMIFLAKIKNPVHKFNEILSDNLIQ
ncbi:MAG: knotted carbamoyltransferase YgeW [Candidatus Cloacimonetes bacterium]|nr:knotted carbamoyltransferase YgeW [Candidatus Cloacimonadota bacterium]